MKKRMRPLISTSVLVIVIGSIFFAGKPQLSSAQNEGFQSYELIVFCENSSLAAATFWHEMPPGGGTVGRPLMGLKTVCAGKKCSGGPVTLANALTQFPRGVSMLMRTKVNQYQANLATGEGWFLTCLAEGADTPPEEKCEKPAPWFGTPSNCTDVQNPVIAVQGTVATVSMCGFNVWRGVNESLTDKQFAKNYKAALIKWIQTQVGSRVCCDKFRAAAGSDSKCNPRADADCDGIPNTKDIKQGFPALDFLFVIPEDPAAVDPFPVGLNPDDPDFLPPQDECACKWVLAKGRLHCSPDGKRDHFYEAKWRCPSTGNERTTRKSAPATAGCRVRSQKAGEAFELVFLSDRVPVFFEEVVSRPLPLSSASTCEANS